MSFNAPRGSDPKPPRTPAQAGLGDGSTDDVAGDISREIVQVYLGNFGHAPTRARTFVQPQFAVCVLREVLTTSERLLIAKGQDQEVDAARKKQIAAVDDDFRAIVESLTGRQVQNHTAHIQAPVNLAVHVFFFDEGDGGRAVDRAG